MNVLVGACLSGYLGVRIGWVCGQMIVAGWMCVRGKRTCE